jgi:DNA-directed RNA polymerase subunit RPC12/RpoP
MARLKCNKCGAVFEYDYKPLDSLVHVGPLKWIKCPACGKRSFFNVYSSVSDPITYPPDEQEAKEQQEKQLTEEELEKKSIEESKYEKP